MRDTQAAHDDDMLSFCSNLGGGGDERAPPQTLIIHLYHPFRTSLTPLVQHVHHQHACSTCAKVQNRAVQNENAKLQKGNLTNTQRPFQYYRPGPDFHHAHLRCFWHRYLQA